jgi:preprotein translocase subunit SecE
MGNKRGAGKGKAQDKKKRRLGGAIEFTREVRGELRRVNWPNRDQLQQSTAVVLIIVLVLMVYVSLLDYVFYHLARLVFA